METTDILKIFTSPAGQATRDLSGNDLISFQDTWSDFVNRSTISAIYGNPWTNKFDSPRNYYINPLTQNIPDGSPVLPIQWNAFPNRINYFFPSPQYSEQQRLQIADSGPGDAQIVQNPCDPNSPKGSYIPGGPRGWQDEYCEWSVTRNQQGKITSVMFTCENPEYWFLLWRTDPNVVLDLYIKTIGNPNIKIEDLYLYDPDTGKPVIVRETGLPAYNPINKWNSGTQTLSDRGGAMHLTSPPNSLAAEIYLAAAATILRYDNNGPITDPNSLICCARYGKIFRNSDPHIGASVNALVRNTNIMPTLVDPVGLYIQTPDFSSYQLPANAPSGYTPASFWSVTRGVDSYNGYPNNAILHAKYEVPAELGFTVSDITIGGQPIMYGAQIPQTFSIQLAATGIPAGSNKPENYECINCGIITPPYPSPSYFMDAYVLWASLANNLDSLANLTPAIVQVEQGSNVLSLSLLANNAVKDSQISIPGANIKVSVDYFFDLGDEGQLFILGLTTDPGTPLGDYPMLISNPGSQGFPAPGIVQVVKPGSLPAVEQKNAAALDWSKVNFSKLKTFLKSVKQG